MKVIAEWAGGSRKIVQLVAVEWDEWTKLSMVGIPVVYREGSNPPKVWPAPASGITVKVVEE